MKTYKFKTLGLTGKEWIERLEKKKFRIGRYVKELLPSHDFKPLLGGIEYEVVICKIDKMMTTKEIREKFREYETPHPEIACLIRENISDEEIKEMGLWYIITMHEPIKDSEGYLSLLRSYRRGDGPWFNANYDYPDLKWHDGGGFAFVVPQVSTQNSVTKTTSELSLLDLELRLEKVENWIKSFQENM